MIQAFVFIGVLVVAYIGNINCDEMFANRNAVSIEKIMRANNLLYEDAKEIFLKCSEVQ